MTRNYVSDIIPTHTEDNIMHNFKVTILEGPLVFDSKQVCIKMYTAEKPLSWWAKIKDYFRINE